VKYELQGMLKYTGWSKSHDTEKKWNISITARPNGLIFLPRIETCSHSKSIRTRSVRSFVKYDYRPQQENFTFSQVGKKQYKRWWKVTLSERKLNISITTRANELIFLPRIEAYSHSKLTRRRLVRIFVKYIVSFFYL